jgi:3-deoxy-manno-octulosonate cytidylyltransferase (CMP-KDO synthetase)
VSVAIVIPARYGSTRFPGKPLLKETGKFLIQHVYEQAAKSRLASRVVVATDDDRILDAVKSFGGDVVMTSTEHQSGTDRIAEVMRLPEFSAVEKVVNVQGDEPEIDPVLIDKLISAISGGSALLLQSVAAQMATVAAPIHSATDLANFNIVKVVVDQKGQALYFSRSVIPHNRDNSGALSPIHRKHLGIYAYTRQALLTLAQTPPCELEQLEKLEQLRALYLGIRIQVIDTAKAPHGIDTPADYAAFLERMKQTV